MCGIVGYVGPRRAEDVLLQGLRRMEYRGYDSAGMAIIHDGDIGVRKAVGRVTMLSDALSRLPLQGTVGVAHTRWATHGAPSEQNAHPHLDCRGEIAVVHNGIIENHDQLRMMLEGGGHAFRSETDTETICHLLEEYAAHMPPFDALLAALRDLRGTYGLAMLSSAAPRTVFAARKGSPLVIGMGKNRDECFLASDPAALVPYTRDIIFIDEDEVAVLTDGVVETFSSDRVRTEKRIEAVEWSVEEIERGRFPHFMAKEIHEQPGVIVNATRGRLQTIDGLAVLGGLKDVEARLRNIDRLTIVGCGTAHLAGTVGEYMLEEYAELPTETEHASEFRYRKPVIDPAREAVIAVSQSGETADTIGALREAKQKGALTIGIVNVVGSTVARETDAGVYTHAGPEIAVASTKAFLAQVTVFALLTLHFGRRRRMSQAVGTRIAEELLLIPSKIEKVIAQESCIKMLAEKYAGFPSALFLGRKYNAPVAMEGALKLKELAYIHAEGYAAGEMKHGPIALLDGGFPVIAIVTRDSVYEKMKSNLQEAKARGAPILAIASEGDEEILHIADEVIWVPRTIELLSPLVNVIPLQMFAYHAAIARGLDPDHPRNLAKSVTVE